MSTIKVTAIVDAYEGEEYGEGDPTPIEVHSHWNRNSLVVLVVGEQEFAVVGQDLILAVQNCMRTSP